MFSRRTDWDRQANALDAALRAARARGPLLDLTESNPTRAGLAADPGMLAAAFHDARLAFYEPEPLGIADARETVARWHAARGVVVEAGRIALTASTSEAYSWLFKLACDPGDAVLVPQPSYPLFDVLARLEHVEIVPYRLRLEDRWRLDVDALASRLTDRTRAVLVVNPNNPTGSLLDDDEAAAVARLCADRGLALVSDEVFADFTRTRRPYPTLLHAGEAAGALTFALSGLSKACGLPQVKLGWMALAGERALVDEALARLDVLADSYLSVSTPAQVALPRLLDLGESFRERATARIARNGVALAEIAAGGAFRVLPAEAGWSAILELPHVHDETAAAMLLLEHGVVVQPGWYFDLRGGHHLVVSLLPEPSAFDEGLALLARALHGR